MASVEAIGTLNVRGYAAALERWREAASGRVTIGFATRVGDLRRVAEAEELATMQVLALVDRDASLIVQRYQLASVESAVAFLNSYGLNLAQSAFDQLVAGRVGDDMTRTTPAVYTAALRIRGVTVEQTLAATRIYLQRIANTKPYRIGYASWPGVSFSRAAGI
jgi:hypothetical protein